MEFQSRQFVPPEDEEEIQKPAPNPKQASKFGHKLRRLIVAILIIITILIIVGAHENADPEIKQGGEIASADLELVKSNENGRKQSRNQTKTKQSVPAHDPSQLGSDNRQFYKQTSTEIIQFPQQDQTAQSSGQLIFEHSHQQIQEFINAIEKRAGPSSKQAEIAYAFYENADSKMCAQAEYFYYDRRYNIGKSLIELPICVISTGRNLHSRNLYENYILSLSRQNYSNFRVTLIDDASTDNSSQKIYEYVGQFAPNLKSKIQFARNQEPIGAFANKDSGIKWYCDEDDIVVDIDADDSLIGRQVFKIINTVYQNGNIWVAYSNFLKITDSFHRKGGNMKLNNVAQERGNRSAWHTSHLKTYRFKLYNKIPLSYLIENHVNASTGLSSIQYPRYASDQSYMFSMIELAGANRIMFIPSLLYAYMSRRQLENNTECHRTHQIYDQLKSRVKTPLKTLQSLDDTPTPITSYTPSPTLLNELQLYKQKYQACFRL